jgi:Flp pilus assembly protein TadG
MLHSFFHQEHARRGRHQVARPRRANARRRTRGQAMVEMALVMTILLMVILGGIDGLQILMTQYTVNQAVRASAHQAALIGGPDGTNGSLRTSGSHATGTVADTARVILDSGMLTEASNATITVTCTRNSCRRYDPITVRITYQADIWAPIGPFKLVKADHSATRLAEKDDQ